MTTPTLTNDDITTLITLWAEAVIRTEDITGTVTDAGRENAAGQAHAYSQMFFALAGNDTTTFQHQYRQPMLDKVEQHRDHHIAELHALDHHIEALKFA